MRKLVLLLALALALALAACGAEDGSYLTGRTFGDARNIVGDSVYMDWDWAVADAAPPAAMAAPEPPEVAVGQAPAQRTRHVIQRAYVNLESTPEDFDHTTEALRAMAPTLGGFVEQAELFSHWGRYPDVMRHFTITLRIPTGLFEAALHQVEALALVTHSSQDAEDVTDRFYDMQGRLETRRIEETRVLALIEEAETIHDLLALEDRLSQVRLQIDRYQSQLAHMAQQVAYSTIVVNLRETTVPYPLAAVGLGGRIQGAFGASVDGTVWVAQELLLLLVGASIPLLFVGIILFTGIAAGKAAHNKRKVNSIDEGSNLS